MGRLRQTTAEIQAILDKVEQGGTGLKYSEERTVYLTKMAEIFGDVFENEITEEQRVYNIDTYTKACNDGNVFVTVNGVLLSLVMTESPTGYASFSCVMELGGVLVSFTITISYNGDAVAEQKQIKTGGASETPSDMNSDFSNDF